jgi:hypothetical protein
MRELVVHQLPVVDEGQPCGVLLERDLHVARQLGASFDDVAVATLLPRAAFSVQANEPLVTAIRTMASRAAAHAVVLDGASVCGVLTTSDALRVLADLLEAREGSARREGTGDRPEPAHVDEVTMNDVDEVDEEAARDPIHALADDASEPAQVVQVAADPREAASWTSEQSGCSLLDAEYLIERIEDFAGKLLRDESAANAGELVKSVRELHDVQATLLASERRELAQTRLDEEPLHRTRLEQLSEERARHTQALATLLLELGSRAKPTSAIAGHALQAIAGLRTYIERERDPLRFVS